jgi:hypothetical protein
LSGSQDVSIEDGHDADQKNPRLAMNPRSGSWRTLKEIIGATNMRRRPPM